MGKGLSCLLSPFQSGSSVVAGSPSYEKRKVTFLIISIYTLKRTGLDDAEVCVANLVPRLSSSHVEID